GRSSQRHPARPRSRPRALLAQRRRSALTAKGGPEALRSRDCQTGRRPLGRPDADPPSPRKAPPKPSDLAIVEPAAVAAGKAYDRQFDPRYLFDVGDVAATEKHFANFVNDRKLRASVERLGCRIPHLDRARLAIEAGGGAGVV